MEITNSHGRLPSWCGKPIPKLTRQYKYATVIATPTCHRKEEGVHPDKGRERFYDTSIYPHTCPGPIELMLLVIVINGIQ
jgi:hypothetical protein